MSKIYLAGPLFNRMELAYNKILKQEFAELGYDILLPQEQEVSIDGERMFLDKPYAEQTTLDISMGDFALIDQCRAVIINLDGVSTDTGACVELGYAYAKGIPCFAIKTDARVDEFGLKANMMVLGAVGNRVGASPEDVAKLLIEAGIQPDL